MPQQQQSPNIVNKNNGWHEYQQNSNNGTPVAEHVYTEEDLLQDETLYFERNRIQQLKDERRDIQKKTFTKWCNSYLGRARLEIQDLFIDLRDGILLMKFLEIISGEKLGKPNRGRMRVQKIENLNRCLEFLKHKRIQLENIGAEDIADGNERLILGLIWTVILRFTIENIEIETKESGERKHAKEALLLWCQRKTAGYPNMRIDNFSSSWRNGLAFCALIHAHHPELLNYDILNPQDPLSNLNLAFDIAENKLDIARLLDAEDVNVACPDEKSVITYVSLFYHCFAKQKTELTGARRVAKVVGELVHQDRLQEDYEQMASDLLCWINKNIRILGDRQFPNQLDALRELLGAFNCFRKEEKPSKYREKGELEALFFSIQTKRNATRRRPYFPPESLSLHDVEIAWAELERAEHARQGALITELQRQERLELRAQLFHKKADVRDTWLTGRYPLLGKFEYQPDQQSVEDGLCLLRNISAEALSKTDRFALLSELSAELQKENFHAADQIRARERDILGRWNVFFTLLNQREAELARLRELSTLLCELEGLGEDFTKLGHEMNRRGLDNNKHLAAVDELLRKQELTETNIRTKQEWLGQLARRVRDYTKQAATISNVNGSENGTEMLHAKLKEREIQLETLLLEMKERKVALQKAREFFQFIAHWEEQRGWLADRLAMCRMLTAARDVSMIGQAQRVHNTLESEIAGQWERSKLLISDGERLGQPEEVQWRLESLQKQWEELRAANAALMAWLSEADRFQQYFQDVNEAESWIRERVPLARSQDYGRDIGSAECLWRRHRQLEKEIQVYKSEVRRLDVLAEELSQTQFKFSSTDSSETPEKITAHETEELFLPKVVVLYAYTGSKNSGGLIVARGEELALLDASNADWWRVLTRTGLEGYVPANYCELVPEETITVTQSTQEAKSKPKQLKVQQSSDATQNQQHDAPSAPTLSQRQKALNTDYQNLCALAANRSQALEETLNLFEYFVECNDFEHWAKGNVDSLQEPVDQEHVLALQQKLQKMQDEIRGQGQTQLNRLNQMAEELLSQAHSRASEVLTHKERVLKLWAQLQKCLEHKRSQLEKTEKLWQFNEKCTDTKTCLLEKRVQLQKQSNENSGTGANATGEQTTKRTLQNAQKTLQNLERDLRPLGDRIKTLWDQAEQIAKDQPEHSTEVRQKVQELDALHNELLCQARACIEEAEWSQGQQMFEQAAKELSDWASKCHEKMQFESFSDKIPAEDMFRQHADLREEIEGKQFEFDYVEELARRLMQKGLPKGKVQNKLRELGQAQLSLEKHWQEQAEEIRQLLDWQAFAKEADRINSLSKGHLAFLELSTKVNSVEQVENLLKGQAEFEARLSAQEERVLAFAASAERLISSGHVQSAQIGQQKADVIFDHQKVLHRTKQRRVDLECALALEGFRQEAGDLGRWIDEKCMLMKHRKDANQGINEGKAENSTNGLQWAKTRHQAFILELCSNRMEVKRLKRVAADMINDRIAEQLQIVNILDPVESNWAELESLSQSRSDRLEQEEERRQLLVLIRDVEAKLDEIEQELADEMKGRNLRGVKDLLKQKAQTEHEIQLLNARIVDISNRVEQMKVNGHFAATELKDLVNQLLNRSQRLKAPLERKSAELAESLDWYQLAFDADVELQWIDEKLFLTQSKQFGNSLTDSQQLLKRHDQLSTELVCHHSTVNGLLQKGNDLANSGHHCHAEIEQKCAELKSAWTTLTTAADERKKLLAWSATREQLLFELNETENWLGEKYNQLEAREQTTTERQAVQQLLTWLKALDTELASYQNGLAQLEKKCTQLVEQAMIEHKDQELVEQSAKELASKQLSTKTKAIELEKNVCAALDRAHASLEFYILVEQQHDLEECLEQQIRDATCEDCGADLDQWNKLQAKFDECCQQLRYSEERLRLLKQSTSALLQRAPEYARQMMPTQNRLQTMWKLLEDHVARRETALAQAERQHRFQRDLDVMEKHIQDKKVALSTELGRDAKQAYALILKHEIFENELAQLQEQIEALMVNGNQFGFDFGNHQLANQWAQLRAASLARGRDLLASYETHKFNSEVRDLMQWAEVAQAEMAGEQLLVVKDLQTAEWLAEEHRRLRAELEGRLLDQIELKKLGAELVKAEQCPEVEVQKRLEMLEQVFAEVRKEWALKADWLEQAVQWHAFQREALQVLAQLHARDRTLEALEQRGGDPESCQRELATLFKMMAQMEERVTRLEESAMELCEQGHAEKESIEKLTRRVLNALNELGEHSNIVKIALDATQTLRKFETEMIELLDWIKDKEDRLNRATKLTASNNLTAEQQQRGITLAEKLDRLKKQQALQSELDANKPRLETLKTQMERLKARHRVGKSTAEAITSCGLLLKRWDQLCSNARSLDEALEEVRELLELEQLIDRLCAYVRAKDTLVQANELGNDLEHCQTLESRLDENQNIDESTLEQANALGQRLLARGSNEVDACCIRDRLRDINECWQQMSLRISAYRALLQAAMKVHQFNWDVDETNQRIAEKAALLANDELGKDLQGVERLLRAQDKIERDMLAIHRKLNEHDEQAKHILNKEPPLRETVLNSLRKLELSWQQLAQVARDRRNALKQSLEFHTFLDAVRRMEQWAQIIRNKMENSQTTRPRNVEEVERALQTHLERQVEINSRDEELKTLREFGQRLAQEQPEHRTELQRVQRRLQTVEHQTRQCWESEQQKLERTLQLQKLLTQIGQIDCWLAGKQAQLDGLISDQSPESVDATLRELGYFTEALAPQLVERNEQLNLAEKTLDTIVENTEALPVYETISAMREKCAAFESQIEIKQRHLNAVKSLALFLRECAEFFTWMNTKLQLAMDDGYFDATALRLKLKKHIAFDAEIRASQDRVDRLQKKGEQLLANKAEFFDKVEANQDADQIRAQLNELTAGWTELLAKSGEKTVCLQQAYSAHQLSRRIADVEIWVEKMETQISSNNHGTNIDTAEKLSQEFELIRAEIKTKDVVIRELVEAAIDLCNYDDQLMDRAKALQSRWEAMDEPCQIRAENLEEAVRYFAWIDQADEQLEWLAGHIGYLESTDYGGSLHQAQSFMQKHQILEQEFDVRQPCVDELIKRGEQMIVDAGGARGTKVTELTERLGRLRDLIALFKALATVRAKLLAESLKSQEFYAEATEAEHWMKERLPKLTNLAQLETGRMAETQLRGVNVLQKEIDSFSDQLKRLSEKCERMVQADHFDLTGLQSKYSQLQELFAQLNNQCRKRKVQIEEMIRYFNFVRRANELLQWLTERLAVAEREDYGQDLEECEQLGQQFQQITRELAVAGTRVAQVLKEKDELLRAKHPNAGSIRAKAQDVQQLWTQVDVAAKEREQALLDGKNIHLFDQKADELLERLAEKEAHLLTMSNEQLGGMELTQMCGQLERYNNEFMHSLEVLTKQVNEHCAEADRIVEAFPRTADHLEVRRSELVEQLKDVREGAKRQAERLTQAQANYQYFQEFRELMAWARQMQTTITGELLPRDIAGSEALLVRHSEYRREIGTKESAKLRFVQRGEQMVFQGNALTVEIRARINLLEETFTELLKTWHRREQIYEDNADLQRWLATASELERWLTEREQMLRQDLVGLEQDGVEGVEQQIRHFDDFMVTLEAQGSYFEALKRQTRVEQRWERICDLEQQERDNRIQQNEQRSNRRETQPIRTLEKKKMLQEKRQERERRKTQEISLMNNNHNGDIRQHSASVMVDGNGNYSLSTSNSVHSNLQMTTTTTVNGNNGTTSSAGIHSAGYGAAQTLPRTRSRACSSEQPITLPSAAHLSIEITAPPDSQQMQLPVPTRRTPSVGRTPGFTTRRTQSIRRSQHWDDFRSIDIHGYLDRKQELQAGGKRATFRSWKGYYSILCGQLLCFFKDEHHFMENMAASAPLALHGSHSAICPEYVKRRYVFRLNTADGAEFLFAASDQLKALEWVDKLNFRAKLAPADQLLAFRPTSSEPMSSSQHAEIQITNRSRTLELKPEHRNCTNQNEIGSIQNDHVGYSARSATLDPKKMINHGQETFVEEEQQHQFMSCVQVGDENDTDGPKIEDRNGFNKNGNSGNGHQLIVHENADADVREKIHTTEANATESLRRKNIKRSTLSSFLRRSSATLNGGANSGGSKNG